MQLCSSVSSKYGSCISENWLQETQQNLKFWQAERVYIPFCSTSWADQALLLRITRRAELTHGRQQKWWTQGISPNQSLPCVFKTSCFRWKWRSKIIFTADMKHIERTVIYLNLKGREKRWQQLSLQRRQAAEEVVCDKSSWKEVLNRYCWGGSLGLFACPFHFPGRGGRKGGKWWCFCIVSCPYDSECSSCPSCSCSSQGIAMVRSGLWDSPLLYSGVSAYCWACLSSFVQFSAVCI